MRSLDAGSLHRTCRRYGPGQFPGAERADGGAPCAALGLTGGEPGSAATFPFGIVALGFALTWWVAIPVDVAGGAAYAAAEGSA